MLGVAKTNWVGLYGKQWEALAVDDLSSRIRTRYKRAKRRVLLNQHLPRGTWFFKDQDEVWDPFGQS